MSLITPFFSRQAFFLFLWQSLFFPLFSGRISFFSPIAPGDLVKKPLSETVAPLAIRPLKFRVRPRSWIKRCTFFRSFKKSREGLPHLERTPGSPLLRVMVLWIKRLFSLGVLVKVIFGLHAPFPSSIVLPLMLRDRICSGNRFFSCCVEISRPSCVKPRMTACSRRAPLSLVFGAGAFYCSVLSWRFLFQGMTLPFFHLFLRNSDKRRLVAFPLLFVSPKKCPPRFFHWHRDFWAED